MNQTPIAGPIGALFIVLLALLYFGAGNADLQEAERQEALYQEMFKLYCETNGQYGWPPRKGDTCHANQ